MKGIQRYIMRHSVVGLLFVVAGVGCLVNPYPPESFQKLRESQLSIRDDFSALLLQEDQFVAAIDGLTTYFRGREDKELYAVFARANRKNQQPVQR